MKHSEILEIITKETGKTPTQQTIANVLGMTKNAISARSHRDMEYSVVELEKLSKAFSIDFLQLSWIKSKMDEQDAINAVQKEFDSDITVDYYPDVFGSCGSGHFVLSETKERLQLPKKIIKNYSSFKKYSVINAYGDSMQPYIHDKDLLIVEHYDGEQIKDNRVYVFRFGENIFVKRLILNINQLVIKSDNAEYKPITLELNNDTDIQIIGQIVGLMRGMV